MIGLYFYREVTQQFLQTQEKAHACAKNWGNLKGKRVKSYGGLTPHDLSMHCKNLYELSLAKKMTCYGSLAHMYPFFISDDICIGLRNWLLERQAIFNV